MKGKRLTVTTVFLMLIAGAAIAQAFVPQRIKIEERLVFVTQGGQEVPITSVTQLRFSVFQGGNSTVPGSGSLVYQETAVVDPNNLGFFTHLLGSGTPTFPLDPDVGTLAADDFFSTPTTPPVFLDIQILSGPTTGQVTRQQFVTVPYAFQAEQLGGLPRDGFVEGVIAGSGLAGGGSGGDVTLSLAPGGVSTVNIVDGSVTTAKIADGAVTSSKILDGGVGTQDLADSSVTSAKIADGSVGTLDLADGAVTSPKIADGTVGLADLAANSVDSSKIVDGSIAAADVNTNEIQRRVTGTCTEGNAIRVVNVDGTVTCQAAGGISGSGTTNFVAKFTGTTTIGNSTIFETAGNVGIGTTTPDSGKKLHIVDNELSVSLGRGFQNGVFIPDTFDIQYNRNNGIRIRSKSNTPSSNAFSGPALQLIGADHPNIPGAGLVVIDYGSNGPEAPSPATAAVIFRGGHPNLVETMRLTRDGNLGIGTTTPTFKLDVVGSANASSLCISADCRTSWPAAGVTGAGTVNFVPKWTSGNSLSSTSQIFDNGTNVGIGTTNPLARLHVQGGIQVPNDFGYAGTTAIGSSVGILGVTSDNHTKLASDLNKDVVILHGSIGGVERMRIQGSTGNVGIGTTSPTNILTIAQGSASDAIADAWTTYSSRRWKTNIATLKDALWKVERLRGVSFDWKADGKRDIGLIAEEVGQVVPEVVAYEENGKDAKSVDYARLTALLVEAVKEQQAQIRELKTEIEGLKAKLSGTEVVLTSVPEPELP